MRNDFPFGYIINGCRKTLKSMIVTTVLIAVLWSLLYSLTDFATVLTYFWVGVAVHIINSLIYNLKNRGPKFEIIVRGHWTVMAGVVLVLYHAGFEAAAVFAAAAILVSPFFWATVYESIVGATLLMMLAKLMT